MSEQPDVCPKCGSRAQVIKEHYTTYQCGSDEFDHGFVREEVACQVIAQLRQQLAEAQREREDVIRKARLFLMWFEKDGEPVDGFRFREQWQQLNAAVSYEQWQQELLTKGDQ